PSNDAFAALPSGTLEALLADPDTLNQVLMHHNVPGILNSSNLVPGETLTTAIGDELTVSVGTDTSMCPFTPCGEEEFCNYDLIESFCELCDDVYPNCQYVSEVQGQQECERKCGDSERRLSEPTETFASTVVNHRRKLQSGGGSLFIDYAQVDEPDLVLTTGIIHGINQVLIPDTHDMISTLEEQGEFTTLLSLIELAELGDAIMTTTPITLFAPTDSAFAKLPKDVVDAAVDPLNRELLVDVLLTHVIGTVVSSSTLGQIPMLPSLSGSQLFLDRDTITVVDVQSNTSGMVVAPFDTFATNGLIHAIDEVLVLSKPPPPSTNSTNNIMENLEEAGDYSTLILLLTFAGLDSVIAEHDGLTLFAPTDDALQALPGGLLAYLMFIEPDLLTDVLLYHAADGVVLSSDLEDGMLVPTLFEGEDGFEDVVIGVGGGEVTVNSASVVEADVICSNGVFHGIGTALNPLKWNTTLLGVLGPEYSTLVQALMAVGGGPPPIFEGNTTLFAPSNDAFAALPSGTLEALLADPETLNQVLMHHNVPGILNSSDLVPGETLTTAIGDELTVSVGTDTSMCPFTPCGEEEFCNYDLIESFCELCDDVYPDCQFVSEVQGQQECERKCGDSERRLSEPTKTFASTVVNHRRKLQSGGGSLFIDYAQVYDPDLATLTTGIIHGINQVLIPDTHDMISTLEEQGEFTTLLSLIELAELGDAIMTTTPITLFAPTDSAFAKLPKDVVDAAVDPLNRELLVDVLLSHVIGTVVSSSTLGQIPMLPSLSGSQLFLDKDSVTVVDVQSNTSGMVVAPFDTPTTNGLIHAIDEVLVLSQPPPSPAPTPESTPPPTMVPTKRGKSGKANSGNAKSGKAKSNKSNKHGKGKKKKRPLETLEGKSPIVRNKNMFEN
ncbi:hypothetical protein THAOC_36547, partial [Thalassiosira oceanica]